VGATRFARGRRQPAWVNAWCGGIEEGWTANLLGLRMRGQPIWDEAFVVCHGEGVRVRGGQEDVGVQMMYICDQLGCAQGEAPEAVMLRPERQAELRLMTWR
jgi:hypothetical protein